MNDKTRTENRDEFEQTVEHVSEEFVELAAYSYDEWVVELEIGDIRINTHYQPWESYDLSVLYPESSVEVSANTFNQFWVFYDAQVSQCLELRGEGE